MSRNSKNWPIWSHWLNLMSIFSGRSWCFKRSFWSERSTSACSRGTRPSRSRTTSGQKFNLIWSSKLFWFLITIEKRFSIWTLFPDHSNSSFLLILFPLFYTQLTVNKNQINMADGWIRTQFLWYQKRPIGQLGYHCPFISIFYHN